MEENTENQEPLQPNSGNPNPTPDTNGKIEGDPTKIKIKRNPGQILMDIIAFTKDRLSLRQDKTDYREVARDIKDGVTFKGYNVWILMCSIVVASVGLNMDSTAVIIGAMLISPLMGPIRGIGFGVAQNDFPLLIDSIKNLGVTVGISILVSFLYFLITPIHETTSELFGRTSPTFLDVVIAFFGGLAGIIAAAKGKNDTVIPGVAIATALMPPLCTAGYGLASGNMTFFLGAFYLFLLNSLLIALSTFLTVKYLRFPIKEYVNPKVERKVRMYIIGFMVLIIAPSAYLFYKMSKRSIFEGNATAFYNEVVVKNNSNVVVNPMYTFDWDDSEIALTVQIGHVDELTQKNWKEQLKYFELEDVDLRIIQGADLQALLDEELSNIETGGGISDEFLENVRLKDNEIYELRERIIGYQNLAASLTHGLDMQHLLEGYRIDYPEITNMSINRAYSLKDSIPDTSYVIYAKFDETILDDKKLEIKRKLSKKFLFELESKKMFKQDTVYVYDIE
ncbi:MAG: TIGR00341 family protein [Crocinitomicaceae bacterium]|nr:TIGR00341 family protein [Crocinitomicaceae bacterium]